MNVAVGAGDAVLVGVMVHVGGRVDETVIVGVRVAVGGGGLVRGPGNVAVGSGSVGRGLVAEGRPPAVTLGKGVALGAPGTVGPSVGVGGAVEFEAAVAEPSPGGPPVGVEELFTPPKTSGPGVPASCVPRNDPTTAVCISSGLN